MIALRTKTMSKLAVMLGVGLAGCGNEMASTGPKTSAPPATADSHHAHDHADHAHPVEGPHHGELIELGNEEYHAELLHDEKSGTVTIYVLDAAAASQVPIEAGEVSINARHEGTPVQVTLTAQPEEGDPDGRSSRFVSNDKNLADYLDAEGANPQLVLTIDGKSYRGMIVHDHDHEHGHAHD